MPKTHYHVAPRYTPGSPAQVSQAIAERVMEREGYARALEGVYGADDQRTAHEQGLAGIVYTTTEVRSRWIKHDLLTGLITSQRIKRDGSIAPEITRLSVA
jgi:hypothetical protein